MATQVATITNVKSPLWSKPSIESVRRCALGPSSSWEGQPRPALFHCVNERRPIPRTMTRERLALRCKTVWRPLVQAY